MRWVRQAIGVLCAVGAADCTADATYVHVYVQGTDISLTGQPFEIQASAFATGKRSDLTYGTRLHPAQAPATLPYTDFVLDLTSDPSASFDLRIATKDNNPFGGDAHVAPPAGQPILVTLARGEDRPFPDVTQSLLDGDMQNATFTGGGGLALAWVDGKGVRSLSTNPDRFVGRGDIVCSTCGTPKALRIASRPVSPFGSDLFAIAWIDSGHAKLKTHVRSAEDQTVVDLAPASQPISTIALACFQKGGAADVVVLRLEGQDVIATLHDDSGTPIGDAMIAVTGAPERVIVGAVTLVDSYVVGLRSPSRMVRVGLDGAIKATAPIDGDLRAIALSTDGKRISIASSQTIAADAARLDLATYTAADLVRIGDARTVTERAFPAGLPLAPVSIDSCALAWAERRDDGGQDVDVRVQRVDEDGKPLGAANFANVRQTGTWFAPTVVCASQSRAFITFFDRASTEAGNLWLRRLP